MKFAHSVSALVLTLGLASSAFARTSTTELIQKCQSSDSQESVLTELEKESGINFDLESLAGDQELTTLVEEAQSLKFSDHSAQALQHIRTILKIAKQGVQNGAAVSQSQGVDKEVISTLSNFFSSMMDIFAPVLDFSAKGIEIKAQGKTLSDFDVQVLMSDLKTNTDIYNLSALATEKLQNKIEAMDDEKKDLLSKQMDAMTLNIHAQTCLAAVKEIRK